ncbi:hypothetical protein B296_00039410, partial [Ensete ventricosum]
TTQRLLICQLKKLTRKPLLSPSSTKHHSRRPHCVGRRRSRRRSLVASHRKHPTPASLSPAGICFSQVGSLGLGLGVWPTESVPSSSPLPLTMESQQGWKMRFSFKNATILVCFLNLVAVLLLLHGFFATPKRRAAAGHQIDPSERSVSLPPHPPQLRYILESEEIRRAMEPLELIKRLSPGTSGTYWSDRILVRRPPATGQYRVSPCTGTRRRLVFQLENEAMRRLPAGERGDASFSLDETRRRSPVRRRGIILLRGEATRRLIKEIEQEAYTEPEREIQQLPKQTAAVDLSKRLKDRAMNDVNSQKGNKSKF